MFGHQDQDSKHDEDQVAQDAARVAEPQADATLGTSADTDTDDSIAATAAPTASTAPAIDEHVASDFEMTEPAVPRSAPATTVAPTSTATAEPSDTSTNDLLDLKQNALQQLTPLIGHLDQSPEEKFRTTMMMIQASDNQSLLKTAYEAARNITDEKARAQALLDVVNEINYFTQQQDSQAESAES